VRYKYEKKSDVNKHLRLKFKVNYLDKSKVGQPCERAEVNIIDANACKAREGAGEPTSVLSHHVTLVGEVKVKQRRISENCGIVQTHMKTMYLSDHLLTRTRGQRLQSVRVALRLFVS